MTDDRAEPRKGESPFREAARGPGRSRVRRDWGFTIFAMVLAALACGVGLALAKLVGLLAVHLAGGAGLGGSLATFCVGVPVVLGGLFGLMFVWMGLTAAGEAPCPSCGKTLMLISTGDNNLVLCKDCFAYAEGTAGELWPTADDRVAASPSFVAPFVAGVALAQGCARCGAPEERGTDLTLERSAPKDATTAVETVARLRVPLCAKHEAREAVELRDGSQGASVVFASRAAHRAYCRAAGVDPRA